MSTSRAAAVYHRSPYSRNASTASNSSSENLPPRTLARLAREVRDLHKNPPEGVRLVVDGESGVPANLGELMAELQGPQGTPYETKFFYLKLVFSQDFPASPPRGFFLTKIYHPNVDMSTGAICVNTLKKDWTAETTLSHVLAVIRCLLIVPFPESSLNDEAGKLFMESYTEYAKRARLMADVHGRPFSFSAAASTEDSGDASGSNVLCKKAKADNTSIRGTNINGSGATTSKSTTTITTSSNNANSSSSRVLKNSSDNPLRSNNSKKMSKSGGLSGKMNKKKSLKRL